MVLEQQATKIGFTLLYIRCTIGNDNTMNILKRHTEPNAMYTERYLHLPIHQLLN